MAFLSTLHKTLFSHHKMFPLDSIAISHLSRSPDAITRFHWRSPSPVHCCWWKLHGKWKTELCQLSDENKSICVYSQYQEIINTWCLIKGNVFYRTQVQSLPCLVSHSVTNVVETWLMWPWRVKIHATSHCLISQNNAKPNTLSCENLHTDFS